MDFDVYEWVYLITNLFSIAIVHRFVTAFFDERKSNVWICLLTYLIYFVFTSFVYLKWDIPILTMTVNLITVFIIALNYKSSINKRLLAVTFIYIFMLFPEVVISAATGYFNFPILKSGYYSNISGVVTIRIFTYLESLIFNNIVSVRKKQNIGGIQWITIIFIPVSTLFLKVFLIDSVQQDKFNVIASVIVILMINLVTFYFYDALSASYYQKINTSLIEKEKEMYYNQCLMMEESTKSLQKFRHDINNQFISIQELVKAEKYDKLRKYIETLSSQLKISKLYSTTGNIIIDSIVNFKLNSIINKNVEIFTEIAVPDNLNIEINDTVVIIGNILDNAIDAIENNDAKGKIYFKLVYSQGRIIIKETNNYKTKICYENGEIQSSKTNKENHGLGLKNIEEAVKRHDGYMEINHTNDIFSIDIIIFTQ